jgi:hypothetical protein
MLILAAIAQPTYAFDDYVARSEPDAAPYALAGAVGASAASFLAIALNMAGPDDLDEGLDRSERGKFAVGAGIAGLGLGLAAIVTESDGADGVGAFSMAFGAASMVIGICNLTGGEESQGATEEKLITRGLTLAAAPFVGGSGRGSGAALQLRF